MRNVLFAFFVLAMLFLCIPHASSAFYDPLSLPNNKFGVHILFPSELQEAAKLVNSNNGDWGYVTIPIQSGDKDLKKWQDFMDNANQLHIIPIIRLATEGDYFNTKVWRKPQLTDVLDFANFLNSLTWPTQNRYVIIYNETNRGDEWGGTPNQEEYAQILSYAVTAFKSQSPDFFIISAGLDNAAVNSINTMNEYTFLTQMDKAVPGIFNQIDGLGSHSYPNPAFAQSPTLTTNESITSFRYESNLVSTLTNKKLPIFITETGWSRSVLSDANIANFFAQAFTNAWSDTRIVAVTPFLLEAGAGPFAQFSLLDSSDNPTSTSATIQQLPKIKGTPQLVKSVLASETTRVNNLPVKKFTPIPSPLLAYHSLLEHSVKQFAKYLLHL